MRSAVGVALALACSIGCGDSGGAAPQYQQTTPAATATSADEGDSQSTASTYERFGYCLEQADCNESEACVVGADETFHICLSPCNGAEDCANASVPGAGDVTAAVACSEFEGARRCVISCQGSEDCVAGMICSFGACVWR